MKSWFYNGFIKFIWPSADTLLIRFIYEYLSLNNFDEKLTTMLFGGMN